VVGWLTDLNFGWIFWAPTIVSAILLLVLWRQGVLHGRRLGYLVAVFTVALLAQAFKSNAVLWILGFTIQIALAAALARTRLG